MNPLALEILDYPLALEELASYAHSPPGAKAALSLTPDLTVSERLTSFARIEEATKLLNLAEGPYLGDLVDLGPFIKALGPVGAVLEPLELLTIGRVALASREAREFLLEAKEEAPLIGALTQDLSPFTPLVEDVLKSVGPEGEILDTASPTLARLRRELVSSRAALNKRLGELIRSPEFKPILMDEIVTTRGERFVVPVRAGAASRSRGLVHDWSKSGATAYLEPIETVEDNNRLAYLKNREKEEIARILASLSSQCRDQAEALAKSAAALTLLDLYLAQGRLARAWRATTPLYQPGDGFELKALRHPLLEKRLSQSGRAIVPLDLMADPHEPVLVISGLNAGGKTVALKTLGLTLALAATGLPIPAAWGSRLDFPVEVIAVMGDNQDLTADLSTFSGHVKAINATLKEAREGVVILLDELGGGTDPAEGAALGLAVLEQIRHSGAICLAATHYHLIKSWAALTPGVVSVAVRSSPLGQPVYGLSYGSPGFSGGLAMARRLGLPEELVAKAESYLDEGQKEALALLKRLEDERAALHKEREDLSLARQKLTQTEAATRASLQKQTEAFKRQSQELDREVKAALGRHRREMGELKKTLLASLEAGQTPDPVALNVKAATLAKELAAKRPKEALSPVTPPLTTVNVGQRVLVGKLSRVGVVKAYNPEKDEALVETGGLTVKAALAELFTAQSEDETPKNRVTLTVSRDDRDGLALNLLGQTVAEATSLVDREIDRALLRGQKRLTIIHGQGTGRLRKGLAAYLKTHPKVAELIWPGEGPGGHGVTTVELA